MIFDLPQQNFDWKLATLFESIAYDFCANANRKSSEAMK